MGRIVESEPRGPGGGPREVSSELVARAAAGDRDAQQRLLASQVGAMRRLITRLVSCEADVEDLVQVACVEVLRSLPKYRGEASVRYWVDRIATRVVYKHYRSTRRRRARISLRMEPEAGHACPEESQRTEWREGVEQARSLVDRLKPERRVVFILVAVEGQSLPEVAVTLDLSLSAVKSRYLRARRDLDKWLSAEPALLELLVESEG